MSVAGLVVAALTRIPIDATLVAGYRHDTSVPSDVWAD